MSNPRFRWAAPAVHDAADPTVRRVSRVTLPDGRRARLSIPGGLVSVQAVQALANEATRSVVRRSRALQSLSARVARDHAALSRRAERATEQRIDQLLRGDAAASALWSGERAASDERWHAARESLDERARDAHRRATWHPAIALSSLPLFAIYGRHNLQHNLTILTLLLIWLLGDEMTELLSSRGESDSESKRRSPWWLYVAPAANLFAGHWLLHERQHEPLISGVSSGFERTRARRGRGEPRQNRSLAPVRRALELAPASAPRHVEEYVAVVDLTAYVAKDFELDLIGLTEPPVVATVASISWASGGKRRDARLESVFARVELGKLYVTLTVSASRRISRAPQLLEHAEVAWIVRVLDEAERSRSI